MATAAAAYVKEEQPPPPKVPAVSENALAKLMTHLTGRLAGMISDRISFWVHWQEIAKYLIPRRYKYLITPNQANRGSPINQAIIDNTGTIAHRVCASGMMAGITSPGRPWFRFTLDDQELVELPQVKLWLDEVTKRMLTVFAESNFYTALATMYGDLVAFGTHAMVIREDFEDVIRCYNFCLGEYVLENNPRMEVDTCIRQFVMTVCQVVDEFGLENVSDTVKTLYDSKGAGLGREIIVCHALEPNDNLTTEMGAMRRFPFREVYWEMGQTEKLLRLTGLHENALIAPRWDIVGNDAYGRSPGMDALGDVKQLQVEQKRKAQAIDKMVNPPMTAHVSMKNEPASLLPGGVTYVQDNSPGAGFRPAYEVKPQIGELMEDIKEVQQRVRTTFFWDLFLMISQMDGVQPRNELEILERKEEKLVQLGPVLERFENECLDKAINRTFQIMLRAGLLPPVPAELRGQHVKPEYISILALAQRAAMTTGIERLVTFVGRVAAGQTGIQGIGPEALDTVDWDEAIDQYGDMMGVPAKILRPYAEVLKIRKQRADQQQQMAAMGQAQAAVDGAKTLSETEVGGGQNALQLMLGGGGGGPMAAAA